MDCDSVQDAILDSFTERPSTGTRALIDAHLSGCLSCAAFAKAQYGLDRQLTATLVPPALSDGFRAAVRAHAQREARTVWPDLLPDAMHFGGCAVATVIGLVWLPLSAPVVLAVAGGATLLTHMLLTAVHESLDAAEETAS